MNRVILTLSLALLLVPALGAQSPTETPLDTQEPESAILVAPAGPEALEMTGCTATLDCQDGNVLQCSGNSQCSVNYYSYSISCDGNVTPCPNRCQATRGCKCGTIECWSPNGSCSSGCCPGYVSCNGSSFNCFEACS